MRVFVDFDDVLCETASCLSGLAASLFGCKVAYQEIITFDLQEAFSLSDRELEELMSHAHNDDYLATLPATVGSVEAIRGWIADGHEVVVVTGRPPSCHRGSKAWLDSYGLSELPLIHLDKYGRTKPSPAVGGLPANYSPADLVGMGFDVAIDDSPTALDLLAKKLPGVEIMVFNRPWNQTYRPPVPMRRVSTLPTRLA
jgi:5'' nucleotidase, deoxy (Pyrimidine), cytosolic type C protein (NT5C).